MASVYMPSLIGKCLAKAGREKDQQLQVTFSVLLAKAKLEEKLREIVNVTYEEQQFCLEYIRIEELEPRV